MTKTVTKTASLIGMTLVPALLVLAATQALANPRFGSMEFQIHLQLDAGLLRPCDDRGQPCPTIRGCPLPTSWGREWRPDDEWVRYVERHGHPQGLEWRADRTPARKWNTIVQRYRWWIGTQGYDGGARWQQEHQWVLEYLEQDYYNYWYRQRYRMEPPDPRSHSHGYRAEGTMIFRDGYH